MSTSHTPGPWRVRAVGADGLLCVVPENNISVADCCDMADARLIASAPDLLAQRDALAAALLALLNNEGRRVVSGIGTEHDAPELQDAKVAARAALAGVRS